MPERIINNEFWQFVTKIIIPAFITTTITIAIDMKNNVSKVSFLTAFMSVIIGVGGAYLMGDYIMEKMQGGQITIAVSVVTLLTEKTFKFFLHKLKVDQILTDIFDAIIGVFLKNKN